LFSGEQELIDKDPTRGYLQGNNEDGCYYDMKNHALRKNKLILTKQECSLSIRFNHELKTLGYFGEIYPKGIIAKEVYADANSFFAAVSHFLTNTSETPGGSANMH
jgi:hypothetical protein